VDLSKVETQKDLRRNPAALRGFLEDAQDAHVPLSGFAASFSETEIMQKST
jgi:hypothetical protein